MDERLTFYEKQLLQRMARGQGSVKYVFDRFVRLAGPLLSQWADKGGNSVWVGNANIENRIESLLDDLHSDLLGVLISSVGDSWKLSNEKTDDLIKRYIQGMSISQTLQEKMFARNADAVRDFIRRKDEFGKTISGRVWDVTESAKENLSFYLSSGLSVGRPATLISQDIRQLLNEPDRRFRRVRNAEGKLVPSQPMKDYHPGQGVYRSSYKNALRLAATETNKAYRSADYDRWQQLDFITEIEIMRSPTNHGPCSICDSKAGRYPKDFKFTGWHPFCICVAVPVMMDEEEFAEWLAKDGKIEETAASLNDENYSLVPTKFGRVRIHKWHGKGEREDNIRVASYFADKYGYEIDLLDNPNGKKSADSKNLTLGREEEYKVNKKENPTKSSIDNLLRKAKEQADDIVLWIESDISLGDLRDALIDRVRRINSIKTVTIVRGGKDCTYTREQIVNDSFKIKQADLK